MSTPTYPSLFERTGDIADINTLLVPRASLATPARTASGAADDSLLLCASDLQHSAIYDNPHEMVDCVRAVADRITALAASALETEAVRWEFRWLNPANSPYSSPSEMAWKLVEPKGMQPLEAALSDLRAYRYAGKPCYEVRPLFAQPAPPQQGEYLPMTSAPKDGSLIRMLVKFEDHPLDDDDQPQWTVGFNNLSNTQVDEWQFVGWSWQSDLFCDGTGTPIGWLPMLDAARGAAQAAPAMDAKQLGDAVVKWLGCETTKPRGDTGEPERRIDVSVERLGFAVAAVLKTVTAPAPVAEDADDAARWRLLPLFMQGYDVDWVELLYNLEVTFKRGVRAQAAQPEGGAKP